MKKTFKMYYFPYSKIMLMIFLSIFLTCTCAKEDPWKRLNEQAASLYQQGHYAEGAKVAEEALGVAERTFGPDHPNVATSLNDLALLYYSQGKYAEAEPLYKRSLKIAEKALGPDHPNVAAVLENMAKCCREMGKKDEAEKLEARAKKIRNKR